MKSIMISDFKAKCIQIVKSVNSELTPIQVTIRGEPVVIIYPASPVQQKKRQLGSLKDSTKIRGDLVGQDSGDWELNQ